MEGVRCFDVDRDLALRKAMRTGACAPHRQDVRRRTIHSPGALKRPSERIQSHYHCDTLTDETAKHFFQSACTAALFSA